MNRLAAVLLTLVLATLATRASAHSSSTSYLEFAPADGNALPFTWRVALRDVDALLDLDGDGDGRLTWGEVEDRAPRIVQLAQRVLVVTASPRGAVCPMRFDPLRFEPLVGSGYLMLTGRAACATGAESAQLAYRLFAGVDASHRVLLRTSNVSAPISLAPNASVALATTGQGRAPLRDSPASFTPMLRDGVGHILGGLDHLLFLVALMLPAVVERRGGGWVARDDLRAALVQVAWIATAFTVAHSITLGLASFGLVRVPASIIEPLIAATVLATALNNLWPVVTTRLALAAFGFGLVHGFGFAEVLAPLGLPPLDLARALLAFNVGVEVGQLIVVVGAFALLALARLWSGYPRWILGGGSVGLALVASAWVVERVFDVALLPA
jgi:hypothetical protein